MRVAMNAGMRALLFGALLWLAPGGIARAQDYNFPQLTGRVVDEANILDAATKIDIETKLEDLETKTSTQFVVVTLSSLRGRTVEDYGYQLGRAWGIGQKGTNNGVLLIVAPNERKVRIEVGYGLEGTLTDAITSVIVQGSILPRFRVNDYQGGIQKGVDAVLQVLAGNADEFKPKPKGAGEVAVGFLGVILPLLFSFPGLILLLLFLHMFFWLFVKIGEWLGLIPPKAQRKKSRWSWIDSAATGGYVGGSSGSSWSSGGGGGGGFSGGGGSFGGGGSSGSW
jgi:uncharacterized protein